VSNHPRAALTGDEKRLDAIAMINVPMSDDEGMNWSRRLLAQHACELRPELPQAAVDEDNPLVGVESGYAAEPRLEIGPLGNFDRTSLPIEPRFLSGAALHILEALSAAHNRSLYV